MQQEDAMVKRILVAVDNGLPAARAFDAAAELALQVGAELTVLHVIDMTAAFVPQLGSAREWPADLIVIGTDSRGRLSHFLLGSTADSIVRRAPCPVVTVRADARIGWQKTPSVATAV
jgi:nucleotide-binding universal stress UspA family protein